MNSKHMLLFVILMLIGVGCTPTATADIRQGDLLYSTVFESASHWHTRQQGEVRIGVRDGAYRMTVNVNQFVMGFGVGNYTDVIISVDANQLSPHRHNAYGVACRASIAAGSTNGYYFLIGGDGTASLRIGRWGEIEPLIAWYRTPLVNQGVAVNRMKIICVDNYLALYVNDRLLYEMRDDTYTGGYVGFLVASEAGYTTEIAFDNLFVYAGEMGN